MGYIQTSVSVIGLWITVILNIPLFCISQRSFVLPCHASILQSRIILIKLALSSASSVQYNGWPEDGTVYNNAMSYGALS